MTPRQRLHELRKAHKAQDPEHFRWGLWKCGTCACVVGTGAEWPALQDEGLSLRYEDDSHSLFIEPSAIGVRLTCAPMKVQLADFFGLDMSETLALVYFNTDCMLETGLATKDELIRWFDVPPHAHGIDDIQYYVVGLAQSTTPANKSVTYNAATRLLDRLCERYPL